MGFISYRIVIKQNDPDNWYPARTHRLMFRRLHKTLRSALVPSWNFNRCNWGKLWKKGKQLIPLLEIDVVAPRSYLLRKQKWVDSGDLELKTRVYIITDDIWHVTVCIQDYHASLDCIILPLRRLAYGNWNPDHTEYDAAIMNEIFHDG